MSEITDHDIACTILRYMRQLGLSMEEAIAHYVRLARWFDINRLPSVRKAIGKIGAHASQKRAAARKNQRRRS